MEEDMLNCPQQIRVYFTFSTGEINYSQIDYVHLYVFDENDYYVEEYFDKYIAGFNANYYIDCFGIPPGKYRFIAWTGKYGNHYTTSPASFIKGQTTFDDALLMLERFENVIPNSLPHIFHAKLPVTVVSNQSIQYFYMPLTQLSNTINIRTVGLPSDANAYRFNITDNNCTYTFDCSFAVHSHPFFRYTTPCSKDEFGQLSATTNVLRLSANRRTPQLHIYNETSETMLYPVGTQSGDLIGLILGAYPQNDFDLIHTYDIVLYFSGDASTGFNVTVSVNGWQVHDQNEELIE